MGIGIVIVQYGEWDVLLRCLQALRSSSDKDVFDLTIIDNGSTNRPPDDEVSLITAFQGDVRLVRNEKNVGFGKACNQAAALMEGRDAYLILNPDVEVDRDMVETLWTLMHSDPLVGIVGPRLTYPDGTVQDSYRRFPRPFDQFIKRTPLRKARFLRDRVRGYLMWDKDKDRTEEVDWLVGACLLVRSEAWQAVGGFDERFFLFYEDVDLCRRVSQAGYRVVYHPAAHALHRKQRLSEGGLLSVFTKKTLRIHLSSALKYFWKWRTNS